MIKKLLTVATIICSVTLNAQVPNFGVKAISSDAYVLPSTITTSEKAVSSATSCGILSLINSSVNVTYYTAPTTTSVPGCSPFAGYFFGNNCYGFKEHATFFGSNTYSAVSAPSITAVSVGFYRNPINTLGTHGTGSVTLKVYAGTSNTIAPGASITSTTASLASIIATQTGTSSILLYTFTLTPTALPATGFYTSLVLPTGSIDTAVVFTQTTSASTSTTPATWFYSASSTWSNVAATVSLSLNHVFIPNICGTVVATGISTNLGLSKDVKIMPNPSTGLVNITLALAQTENINIIITNALGQQILANHYDGISNEMLTLDLTSQPNGVYFVTINNGKDKMVQRLILNR